MLQPPEHSLFVKYDEQVVFKDATVEPIEGRLRFHVANSADPSQRLTGQSPAQGETQRMDTPTAQPLEKALRYAQLKFDA